MCIDTGSCIGFPVICLVKYALFVFKGKFKAEAIELNKALTESLLIKLKGNLLFASKDVKRNLNPAASVTVDIFTCLYLFKSSSPICMDSKSLIL